MPYDTTSKELVSRYPYDWLALFRIQRNAKVEEVVPLDTDLSNIKLLADKLLLIKTKPPYIVHIELQTSYEARMAERFMVYNGLIGQREGLPVLTVVVLLRRKADGACMRQPYRLYLPHKEEPYHTFDFQVVRLWELPVEVVLYGGLGTLPLAPLCKITKRSLPEVIHRMRERIEAEASGEEEELMWTRTQLLMGLRYTKEEIESAVKGVFDMRDSVVYQAILQEGMERGVVQGIEQGKLDSLLLVSRKRLGEPSVQTVEKLHTLPSSKLEELLVRLFEVETWAELLKGV